jgi:hypothetical protein
VGLATAEFSTASQRFGTSRSRDIARKHFSEVSAEPAGSGKSGFSRTSEEVRIIKIGPADKTEDFRSKRKLFQGLHPLNLKR